MESIATGIFICCLILMLVTKSSFPLNEEIKPLQEENGAYSFKDNVTTGIGYEQAHIILATTSPDDSNDPTYSIPTNAPGDVSDELPDYQANYPPGAMLPRPKEEKADGLDDGFGNFSGENISPSE